METDEDAADLCLEYLNIFSFVVAVTRALSQAKMLVFDLLGMRLNNQLSLWCVYQQLGQNPLILPLSLIVPELH